MRKWPTVRLGDLFQIKHGFAFKGVHFSSEPGPVVLTPGNFEASGGLKLRPGKDRSYQEEFPAEYMLKAGELLVVMTDLTQEAAILGAPAFVPFRMQCLHNQRLGKIVDLKADLLNLRFLYYLCNTYEYREYLKSTATGATVKHTSPSRIYDFSVSLPPLQTQCEIVRVLGAYDDLIEINQRRISVLEEMARGLFTEWFTHLRFPGHEDVAIEDTPEGRLPQGWRWGKFSDLATEVRDTISPAEVDPATPYIGLEHISRRSTTLVERGMAESISSLKARFKKGDILFGKIRPYFHKVAWAAFNGIASTDAIIWRPTSGFSAQALMQASDDAFVAHSVQTSNGTKMPRANNKVLANYPCALAPSNISVRFESAVGPMIEAAAALQASNESLTAARDLLLPRLISGQLPVTQAEKELETI